MPNIPTYQSQVRPRRPSGANAEAAARIGEIQQRTFQQLGQDVRDIGNMIDEQQGKQETSALTKEYAEIFAGLTTNWNETAAKADPNDAEVADKWREKTLEPALEKFGEKAVSTKGTAMREEVQAKMRLHFFEKTTADQSALAGHAVQSNLEQSVNLLSQAAYADPSSAEFSINALNDIIEGQIASHALSPAQAAQIRDQVGKTASSTIAKAALRGLAERNPEAAQKDIASGRLSKYLNGEEAAALNTYAINQEKAKKEDARRDKEDAIRDARIASDNRRNEIMKSFAPDPNGTVRIPKNAISQILADPTMGGEDKSALIGLVERLTQKPEGSGELKTDPGTFVGLFNRIHLPDGDPRKITDDKTLIPFVGKGLNYSSYGQLVTEINGKRTQEGSLDSDLKKNFVAKAQRLITGSNMLTGMRDTKGDENYGNFMQQFLLSYDKAIKAGGNPAELLKEGGIFDQMIRQYRRSSVQQMQDMMRDAEAMKAIIGTPGR